MDDVDGHARHLRHGDRAVHGFGLGARGPRECVVDRRGLAFGERLRTITSITLPFSACMQMSAPFFAVCDRALKMVASSTMSTLG